MAETENPNAGIGQGSNPERELNIERIYIKDLSFESPNSPQIFYEPHQPEVDLNLTSNVHSLGDGRYEVVLSVTLTIRAEERTIYLAEIHQAGLFQLRGFAEEEKGSLLGSYCPHTLFPYAREAVSDVVTKGGFPPYLLAPVNFDAIYAQHVQQHKAENSEVEH